jgi:hypothetical protein
VLKVRSQKTDFVNALDREHKKQNYLTHHRHFATFVLNLVFCQQFLLWKYSRAQTHAHNILKKAVPLHATKALEGRGDIAPTHSRPRQYIGVSGQRHRPPFTPGERTPGTHCTEGWVGLRAGLDTEARRKILSPLPGIEPRSSGRPARNQTLYCLSYLGSRA